MSASLDYIFPPGPEFTKLMALPNKLKKWQAVFFALSWVFFALGGLAGIIPNLNDGAFPCYALGFISSCIMGVLLYKSERNKSERIWNPIGGFWSYHSKKDNVTWSYLEGEGTYYMNGHYYRVDVPLIWDKDQEGNWIYQLEGNWYRDIEGIRFPVSP